MVRVPPGPERCRPGRHPIRGCDPLTDSHGSPDGHHSIVHWVMYIVWKVGMPRTLSLYMPPILEPRMIAVPA
jgi:hypothetical protein